MLHKLGRYSLLTGAFVVGSASLAGAQQYYPNDISNGAMVLDTFDGTDTSIPAVVGGSANPSYPGLYNANTNAGGVSFTNYNDNSGDANSWYNIWSPPPPNIRFDFNAHAGLATAESWSNGSTVGANGSSASVGGVTATANNGYDDTPSTNGGYGGSTSSNTPNSPLAGTAADTGGAMALTMAVGPGQAGVGLAVAYTMDLYWSNIVGLNGQNPNGVSFNILVDPTSTLTDPGFANGFGNFSIATRDDSYDYNQPSTVLVNGLSVNGGSNNWELGNPQYSLGPGGDSGTWDSVYAPLNPAQAVRALTFQEYTNGGTGSLTVYIDNVTFYVPEPASFGVLGIGISGLLLRRRRTV